MCATAAHHALNTASQRRTSTRSACRAWVAHEPQLSESPNADPHVRWCGREVESYYGVLYSLSRLTRLQLNSGIRRHGEFGLQSTGIECMSDEHLRTVAAAALVFGALLGMAGSFAPSAELRGLAWGADVALVVGSALLVVHHLRQGHEQLAAGFLVFLAGQTLIVAGSGMELAASAASFAAGAGLWFAGLALISASPVLPLFVRVTGGIAATLFAITAARIFGGGALTPLSKPLPFGAYPFLAITLFGWAWVHVRLRPVRRAGA